MAGMKKEPRWTAAPSMGALLGVAGPPPVSLEVLLPAALLPSSFEPRREPDWRELGWRASWELKRPHRASWELLLPPGASLLAPPKRRELPRAGGDNMDLLSLLQDNAQSCMPPQPLLSVFSTPESFFLIRQVGLTT